MKNQEQLAKQCLEHLSKLSKEQLLEETSQLLLSLQEKGTDLTSLEDFYSKGGLFTQPTF